MKFEHQVIRFRGGQRAGSHCCDRGSCQANSSLLGFPGVQLVQGRPGSIVSLVILEVVKVQRPPRSSTVLAANTRKRAGEV